LPSTACSVVAEGNPAATSGEERTASERCDEIFRDTASGKSLAGRPQLRKALDSLAPGDALVIAEWDRATRSMWDGLQILKEIIDAGATIRVLDRALHRSDEPHRPRLHGKDFEDFASKMGV
jgi:DNA invertase Pin-like site-specific DNA recombinase